MATNKKSGVSLEPIGVVQLGSRVYDSLLSSIASGQMDFGAPLRLNEIARMLQVSTTPVREALSRLESSGLAIKQPNCGWFVRDFTQEQIRDMYEFRSTVESLSVRLACERITKEELDRLNRLQARGQAAVTTEDQESYRLYNREFHSIILTAARNSYLTTVITQLAPQSDMLTARSIQNSGRMPRALSEHASILGCIVAHDPDGAEKWMRLHISNALVEFLQTREHATTRPRDAAEIEEFLQRRPATDRKQEVMPYAAEPETGAEL